MEVLSSSLRTRPAEETLRLARLAASRHGISRVTDVTRLDRLGVPVCISVRPRSKTICVHAGKGLRPVEAYVGAYMEAIEFAAAEPGVSRLRTCVATAHDISGAGRGWGILDLCPVLGASIPLDEPLLCVEAVDAVHGGASLVPAELAFHPAPDGLTSKYFGSSTNGLCSGNDVLEASVHGLLEVLERDIRSFALVRDTSILVSPATLPDAVREVAAAAEKAELRLFVRHCPNEFGLPMFAAYLTERHSTDPLFISGGYGCHLDKSIAVVRAVCEAAQSRLTYIQGARDDLAEHYEMFNVWGADKKAAFGQRLYSRVSDCYGAIPFRSIRTFDVKTLEEAWAVLVDVLRDAGMGSILRVTHSENSEPFVVVKVIVPKLEHFNSHTLRCGNRLARHVSRFAAGGTLDVNS